MIGIIKPHLAKLTHLSKNPNAVNKHPINTKVIIDSAILVPVSWSWIFKPLCGRLNIDYRKIDDVSE